MAGETTQVTDPAAAETGDANANLEAGALGGPAAADFSGAESDPAPTVEQRLEAVEAANKAAEERATAAEAKAIEADLRATAEAARVEPEVERRVGAYVAKERRTAAISNLDTLKTRAGEGDTAAIDEIHRVAKEALEKPTREAEGTAAQAQVLQDRMYRIFLPRVEALGVSKQVEGEFVRLFQAGDYDGLNDVLTKAEREKYATPAAADNSSAAAEERQRVVEARTKAGADVGAGGPGAGSPSGPLPESADLDSLFATEHKRLQGMKR